MSISREELLDWVSNLDEGVEIGIDEGGLSLVVADSEAYYEIGGLSEDESDDRP